MGYIFVQLDVHTISRPLGAAGEKIPWQEPQSHFDITTFSPPPRTLPLFTPPPSPSC